MLGKDAVPPSERIVIGCVGTGGQGTGNMKRFMEFPDVQVVAVCDVDAKHRDKARDLVNAKYGNQDCTAENDFRKLVSRTDLDAVSVCTPDHWHAPGVRRRGQGRQGHLLRKAIGQFRGRRASDRNAVKKTTASCKPAATERSRRQSRYACELVRNGRIGKLHTIRINLPCDDGHHKDVLKMTERAADDGRARGF